MDDHLHLLKLHGRCLKYILRILFKTEFWPHATGTIFFYFIRIYFSDEKGLPHIANVYTQDILKNYKNGITNEI
jgi:hypothetical protein